MGLFNKLFKDISKKENFTPDLNKTEYNNWLEFLGTGGTSDEWKQLLKENKWKFKKDDVDEFAKYDKGFRPLWNKYFEGANELKIAWSAMYNEKCFAGQKAEQFENKCIDNISAYKAMWDFEEKYGKDHMTSAEGYKRLAMLYEKQGRYTEAIEICKEACSLGLQEEARLERMLKKIKAV